MPLRGNGLPRVWASIIARVLGEMAFAIESTVGFFVLGSISINTGVNLFWIIGLTVVGNPVAAVMTSSPGFNANFPNTGAVRQLSANKFAEEPELTKDTYRTPRNCENSFS